MNRIKYCLVVLAAAVGVFAQLQSPFVTSQESMVNLSAKDFLSGVRIGINYGNGMDAIPSVANGQDVAVESGWMNNNPDLRVTASQNLLNGMKESGFDVVRIPVTWTGHIDNDFNIEEAWLNRVAQIIEYAKEAGMKAVIINIHHDGHGTDHEGWLRLDRVIPGGGNNYTGWTKNAETFKQDVKDDLEAKLAKIWTQIANYFKNYGSYLIFETTNEVHAGDWGWTIRQHAKGKAEQEVLYDWNQAALSAIRATGGNNTTRYVAVPAIGGTDPDIVEYAHYTMGKLLPDDGANGTNKLIVSSHFYYPKEYTVNIDCANPKDIWGTATEQTTMTNNVNYLKKFIDDGIAVYVGECGGPTNRRITTGQFTCTKWNNGVQTQYQYTITETHQDNHVEYMSLVAKKFREVGAVPIIWDDAGNFKLVERTDGKPGSPFATRVLNAMMDAVADIEITSVRPQQSHPIAATHSAKWSVAKRTGSTLSITAPESYTGVAEIALYDVRGRQVKSVSHNIGAANRQITFGGKLPAGNYMLTIKNGAQKRETYSTRVTILP